MNVVIIEDGAPVGMLSGFSRWWFWCCCEIKGLVRESENRLALQAERNHCEVMKGQQEIKCLIENTAKDQEIARLNRVVDAQRDQNIINSVVQALGNKTV